MFKQQHYTIRTYSLRRLAEYLGEDLHRSVLDAFVQEQFNEHFKRTYRGLPKRRVCL